MKREDCTDDIEHPLNQALESCQERATTIFIEHLISVMTKREMKLESLIEALASYTHKSNPELAEVTKHLELASERLRYIRISSKSNSL